MSSNPCQNTQSRADVVRCGLYLLERIARLQRRARALRFKVLAKYLQQQFSVSVPQPKYIFGVPNTSVDIDTLKVEDIVDIPTVYTKLLFPWVGDVPLLGWIDWLSSTLDAFNNLFSTTYAEARFNGARCEHVGTDTYCMVFNCENGVEVRVCSPTMLGFLSTVHRRASELGMTGACCPFVNLVELVLQRVVHDYVIYASASGIFEFLGSGYVVAGNRYGVAGLDVTPLMELKQPAEQCEAGDCSALDQKLQQLCPTCFNG